MPEELSTSHAYTMHALRFPRGRYVADRASQLSGVPKSTLYDWRRHGVYIPDYRAASPVTWSYRDLVYLRLLAWLRQLHMDRPTAAERVKQLKREIEQGAEVRRLLANKHLLLRDEEIEDRREGAPNLLPFENFADVLSEFNLTDPVQELRHAGRHRLWAPDLVRPSRFSAISPWVLAGDPCIIDTRIPTAAVYALRVDRGLSFESVAELYPGLTVRAATDADLLERRLRGYDLPEPAAA